MILLPLNSVKTMLFYTTVVTDDLKEGLDKNMSKLPPTTLKHYVARYRMDKELLEKHPESKERLEQRIKRHERDIITYVTSDSFKTQLNYLNL